MNSFHRLFVAALGLAVMAGCARDPKEQAVKRAVERAAAVINRTAFDQVSAMTFASMREQGGGVWDYVAANLDRKTRINPCGEKPEPYCIAIRTGGADDEFIIEGFGAATDKPIVSAKAKARKPRRPGGS